MALSRLQQIFVAEELQEGVGTTLGTGAGELFLTGNAKYLVIDPTLDFAVTNYNRNIKRSSLTPLTALTGTKTGTARFTVELAGDTSATSAPVFGQLLRACGFRQEKLIRLNLSTSPGSITGGPFLQGERVNQAATGAFGRVIGTTYDTEPYLWIAQENGLGFEPGGSITAFNTTQVAGVTSGALATPSSVTGTVSGTTITAPAGYGWFPVSTAESFVRFLATGSGGTGLITNIVEGDVFYNASNTGIGQWTRTVSATANTAIVYYRRISGTFITGDGLYSGPSASGNYYGQINISSRQFQIPSISIGMAKDGVREAIKGARGTVSFAGRIGEPMLLTFEFTGAYSGFQDGGNIDGVTYTTQIPPVLLDADLTHGKTGTSFSAMYGPCISSIDIGMGNEIAYKECMAEAAGIEYAILSSRSPTFTIDPELTTEGAWDYLTQFTSNTPSRFNFSVGSTWQNRFWFKAPGVSWTSVATGDRNGIATRQLTGNLHGGAQTAGSTSENNELVLIYGVLS